MNVLKVMIGFPICTVLLLMIFTVPVVFAVTYYSGTLSITTEKEIYSYGDFLTFTIKVTEITGEEAILHIIDESGKSSSAIPIPITGLETIVPSPFPFESDVYPIGVYTIDLQYSGLNTSTEFELVDSGNLVIPFWIKELSKYWYNGATSDVEFAQSIEFLIKENIIVVDQTKSQGTSNEVKIPNWIKTSTGWWIDGDISDKEFAASIEYLIKVGIIVV